MPWNDENVARLRELWDQGLPTAQIGKLLDFTKNAVVGKAHRIGLERRPSPIRRTAVKPDRKKARSPIMPKLNFVAEQYPDLKADSSFLNLQKELVSIENQVSDRREFYNSSTGNWNSAIHMIPTNIVASTMSAKDRDMFTVTVEQVRQAVKVEF